MVISLTAVIKIQAASAGERPPDMQREAERAQAALEAIGWRVAYTSPASGGAIHDLRFERVIESEMYTPRSIQVVDDERGADVVSVERSVRENINSVTWDEEGAASR